MCKENSGVIYISCSEDHGRKMYLGFWCGSYFRVHYGSIIVIQWEKKLSTITEKTLLELTGQRECIVVNVQRSVNSSPSTVLRIDYVGRLITARECECHHDDHGWVVCGSVSLRRANSQNSVSWQSLVGSDPEHKQYQVFVQVPKM